MTSKLLPALAPRFAHHLDLFGDSRLFSSLFEDFDHGLTAYSRRFEAEEDVNEYTITLQLPGYKQSDIKVEIVEGHLTVSGENAKYGSFRNEISLWRGIDLDKVEAKLENGVLVILLPKLPQAKARTITVC